MTGKAGIVKLLDQYGQLNVNRLVKFRAGIKVCKTLLLENA